MTKAQTSISEQANKNKKEVSYDIRVKVCLSIKNISTNLLSKKLDHKMRDYFLIIGKISILPKITAPSSHEYL